MGSDTALILRIIAVKRFMDIDVRPMCVQIQGMKNVVISRDK
jgi:hypothetical protein